MRDGSGQCMAACESFFEQFQSFFLAKEGKLGFLYSNIISVMISVVISHIGQNYPDAICRQAKQSGHNPTPYYLPVSGYFLSSIILYSFHAYACAY